MESKRVIQDFFAALARRDAEEDGPPLSPGLSPLVQNAVRREAQRALQLYRAGKNQPVP